MPGHSRTSNRKLNQHSMGSIQSGAQDRGNSCDIYTKQATLTEKELRNEKQEELSFCYEHYKFLPSDICKNYKKKSLPIMFDLTEKYNSRTGMVDTLYQVM